MSDNLPIVNQETNEMIKAFEALGIPTHSHIVAVQHEMEADLLPEQYMDKIERISGHLVGFNNDHLYKYTYLYLIQEIVLAHKRGSDTTSIELLNVAKEKAKIYVQRHPWVFAVREEEENTPRLDAAGNPKPKKGVKKDLAIKLWNENQKGGPTTRKGWIELLVAEAGMTKAGASTYYANLKAGRL